MKIQKEWSIQAPWGKIALVSWGTPTGPPVLLVHGRQDSLSTFIPLLEYLPERFHYVGIDMPGNGKSDEFPIGVKLSRFHFVPAVEQVVKTMGWKNFIYIGHSMGCEQGLFFNAVFPNLISKFILLDFGPSLQRLQIQDPKEYYNKFYRDYYINYNKYNTERKLYSREAALKAVMRARQLVEEKAELVLSRNTCPVAHGKLKLVWDQRLKNPAPQNYTPEYYIKLFALNSPPTLLLSSTDETSRPYAKGKEAATAILNALQKNVKNYTVIKVVGGHDVHLTNPERMAAHVVKFLEKDFIPRSKL